MFTSFARRLTSWYVVAAVGLVAIVLGAFAIVALFLYVHLVQENIDADAREAEAFAQRAQLRSQTFVEAAAELERRLGRPGVRIVAVKETRRPQSHEPPPAVRETTLPLVIKWTPKRSDELPKQPVASLPGAPPPENSPTIVFGGRVVQGDPRSYRYSGNRLGFAVQTAFGAHLHRVPFLDGDLTLLPDADATANVALGMLGAILAVGALAGAAAWVAGRYITSQAMRPLVEVTAALQRFAARDFSPQPIAVAGKSDFDAIALAYNAAAAQVAAAFAERQLAETQMRQFVADAGHELRTPLTIVLGYIDLLRRKADAGDERSRRIFTSIAAEGARMRILIDNLVLLARMEGEDARPCEPFPLGALLDEIVDARKLLVPGLQVALDLGIDATVIGSRDEIHEAVSNIIDNAIKYAPGSPIRIVSRPAAGGLELRISDRGPGIHPDDQAGLFDRFYRGATRGDVEGSGLGLAIAKRAVERAGGTLALDSSSPEGTTFVMRLRADKAMVREPRTTRA